MARTLAPLLSWGASGQIAKTQVYSEWKGRPYVRRYVIPSNPDTAEQQLTRNTFRFLNDLWKFLPSGALGAWNLYGVNSRFTARNGWIKQNNGPLRQQTDLINMVVSPAAGSGLVATSITATGGALQITVDLVAPPLPSGWTITSSWAMAIENVNPQLLVTPSVASGSDATPTYQVVLTGLEAATAYLVGGWFQFLKPNGQAAYGQSLQAVESTT